MISNKKRTEFTRKKLGYFFKGFWLPTREEIWPEDQKVEKQSSEVPAEKQSSCEVPAKSLDLSPGKSETWKPLWKPVTPD